MGKKTFSTVFFPFLNDGRILGLVQIIHFTGVLDDKRNIRVYLTQTNNPKMVFFI